MYPGNPSYFSARVPWSATTSEEAMPPSETSGAPFCGFHLVFSKLQPELRG